MKKLYIVGDSFSSKIWDSPTDISQHAWHNLLGNVLQANIVNESLVGASQDYAWTHLHIQAPQITSEDYLVVVLTHPGRFWFFEKFPSLSKLDQIDDYESINGVDPTSTAARNFIRYLQRKNLDTLWLKNRLGWLANETYSRGWRKPLVIHSMQADDIDELQYPDLSFSKGYLYDHVSLPEIPVGKNYENVIYPFDPRYNHMCLSNHAILADKVYKSLTTNIILDLTLGDFKKHIFDSQYGDFDFQQRELSLPMMTRIKNYVPPKKKSIIPAQFRFK